jgi:hypothetical protein
VTIYGGDVSTSIARTFYRRVVAIWLLALLVRAVAAIWSSGMIDGEGAEYARIAQNVWAGVGYVGIATEGKQLFSLHYFHF